MPKVFEQAGFTYGLAEVLLEDLSLSEKAQGDANTSDEGMSPGAGFRVPVKSFRAHGRWPRIAPRIRATL